MSKNNIDLDNLDQTLSQLGKDQYSLSKDRLQESFSEIVRAEKSQNLLAITGLVVSLLAAVVFIFQEDIRGFFILLIVVLAFLVIVPMYQKQFKRLLRPRSGTSLFELLHKETKKRLKHYKFVGPLTLFAYSILTVFVVSLHGLAAAKSWSFIVADMLIGIYVIYRFVITVPELEKELDLYQQSTNTNV